VNITAMSTQISQANLQQQVSISVLKMAMDNATVQSNTLLQTLTQNSKSMELSIQPHLGSIIDLKV